MNYLQAIKSLKFFPSPAEQHHVSQEARAVIALLKSVLKQQRKKADVFVGGSLAKSTLVNKKPQDVDIFVRFPLGTQNISRELETVVNAVAAQGNYKRKVLQGSRTYFRLQKEQDLFFEIVPVLKIKKPSQAENVTDLSYFHVHYVKKHITPKIAQDIVLAKAFCKAQGVYGAESYIQGFSGYALECLLLHYGSFLAWAKAMAKAKDKLIIDQARWFSSKEQALLEMNESKTKGPVVLVDPTWKERNVLAALQEESFVKLQKAFQEFIAGPSPSFFEDSSDTFLDEMISLAKQKKAELLEISLTTPKQSGDIAGTKLKKFYLWLINDLSKQYVVFQKQFRYEEGQEAKAIIVLQRKEEVVKKGPPGNFKKNASLFRKKHKNVFVENGLLYSREKVSLPAKLFLQQFAQRKKAFLKEMDISNMRVKSPEEKD